MPVRRSSVKPVNGRTTLTGQSKTPVHRLERCCDGTLSLYAAFKARSRGVLCTTTERHTCAEFIAFLTDIVINRPPGKTIRVIADSFSPHKRLQIKSSLAAYPHFHLQFTLTYSSWVNAVERWLSKIERSVVARCVFTPVPDLSMKLMRYIRRCNKATQTVKWKYFNPVRRITMRSVVAAR